MCRDCCCGNAAKHPDADHDALLQRLIERTVGCAEVSVSTCLLACERSNVVVVSPNREGRRAGGRPVWLMHVLDGSTVDVIADWLVQGGPGLSTVPPGLKSRVTTIPALDTGIGPLDESVLE